MAHGTKPPSNDPLSEAVSLIWPPGATAPGEARVVSVGDARRT
jgi:hypothetical protein